MSVLELIACSLLAVLIGSLLVVFFLGTPDDASAEQPAEAPLVKAPAFVPIDCMYVNSGTLETFHVTAFCWRGMVFMRTSSGLMQVLNQNGVPKTCSMKGAEP